MCAIDSLAGKTVKRAYDKWSGQPDGLDECFVIDFTDGTRVYFEADAFHGGVVCGIERIQPEVTKTRALDIPEVMTPDELPLYHRNIDED